MKRANHPPRGLPVLMLAAGVAACAPPSGAPPDAALTALEVPHADTAALPHLAKGPDGKTVLSWVETGDDGARLRFATLGTDRWSTALTVASGTDWFVNWADFPSVQPLGGERLAAHWLGKREGGPYAYDVRIATSDDGGRTWSAAVTPHSDDTATEHGFVSLYPLPDGVGAVWLDGRHTGGAAGHGGGHDAGHAAAAGGAMTLRALAFTNPDARDGVQIDDRVCDCCQTAAALSAAGPVVVYRDRSPSEVRDIYVARQTAGQWQPPAAVAADDWKIGGCPVNGPAVDAEGERVAVAWYTEAGGAPRVRVAFSQDAGERFGAAIDVATDVPRGRVDVALLSDGSAAVSWLRGGDQPAWLVRRVAASGAAGPERRVAAASAERASGFARMLRDGARLVFAWTDALAEPSRVRSATLDLTDLP